MNIFGGTEYRYSEEDRLTNAFLVVFEKSEPSLLTAFLNLLKIEIIPTENVTYTSQISYSDAGSRPDGKIQDENFTLLIENKRFENNLDEQQILRHKKAITKHENHAKRFLLAITNSHCPPDWYTELINNEKNITLLYLSWSEIYKLLDEYDTDDERTKLLISEFIDYLSDLGYSYYKPETMKDLIKTATDYRDKKKNLLNLGKKITTHLNEEVLKQSNTWEYHIFDERWLSKWNTLFQFQIVGGNKLYRLNFEISLNNKGWIGITEWNSGLNGNLADRIRATSLNNESYKIVKIGKNYSQYSKELTRDEIDNIFSGNFEKNVTLFAELKYLFSILEQIKGWENGVSGGI